MTAEEREEFVVYVCCYAASWAGRAADLSVDDTSPIELKHAVMRAVEWAEEAERRAK